MKFVDLYNKNRVLGEVWGENPFGYSTQPLCPLAGIKTKNPASSPAKELGEELPGLQYKGTKKWIISNL